jgi:hypothetical protein
MPDYTNNIETPGLSGEGIYLFCFICSGRFPRLKIFGLDDYSTVTQREFNEISAVYTKLSLADFSGSSAKAKLQDLAWVGPRAVRHEKVIETVMDYSSVFPVRFGTIFSSLSRLDETLRIHYKQIIQFLKKVDNKSEWAVKGFLNEEQFRHTIVSRALAQADKHLAALTPGKRYLQERHIALEAKREMDLSLKDILDMIIKSLRPFVTDFKVRKVFSSDSTEKDSKMIVNWAFLVTHNAEFNFRAALEQANVRHAKEGLNFEMSGPWPPYSFCPALKEKA